MFEWPLPFLAMLVHLLAKSRITRFLHCCWIIVRALFWLAIRILYSMCIIWHQRELCCCFPPYLWFMRIMLNCFTKTILYSVHLYLLHCLCVLCCVCLTICVSACLSPAGHRSQWPPEWASGQAEQCAGWAEYHVWKQVHACFHTVPGFQRVHSPHTMSLIMFLLWTHAHSFSL
jgi:hypothetical protein